MTKSHSSKYKFSEKDNAKLMALSESASYKIEELLDELGVDYRKTGKMFVGSCPVHEGDKINAWNFYPDGHSVRGIWLCRTRGCEKVFQKTIPGLVRGILSKKQLGWNGGSSNIVSMSEVINFLCKFVGQNWDGIKVDLSLQEKRKFIDDMNILGLQNQVGLSNKWSLQEIRKRLKCPSEYLISRGFTPSVLDEYSAGEAITNDTSKDMYKRVIIPVMDNDGKFVVGFTGRSLFEKCKTCGVWHNDKCPDKEYINSARYAKWRHSYNFSAEQHLFNFWSAKDHIKRTQSVVLVEGPLDCIKLHSAGIKNVLGLFGNSLSDSQTIQLESSGAYTIHLLLDRDKAGEIGIENIKKSLGRSFKLDIPKINTKDPGEMTIEEIKSNLSYLSKEQK